LNSRKATARQRKTLKPCPLSAAQKRKLDLLEIPKAQRKYVIYEPLHNLWLGYMREILGVDGKGRGDGEERKPYVSAAGAGVMLASADMHGAMVEVVRSRCVSRVGVKGIVVRDCKHVFEIVTRGDCVKCELLLFVFKCVGKLLIGMCSDSERAHYVPVRDLSAKYRNWRDTETAGVRYYRRAVPE
jgi:RNase P/RNase MRP subunit p29